jgi:hypothetical protein
MRFTFVGYVTSLALVACSGAAPYDFPNDPGAPAAPAAGSSSPPPPSSGGQSSGDTGSTGGDDGDASAPPPKDAGSVGDATADGGSFDAGHDAHPDAAKDAGKDGGCDSPADCPALEACLVNDNPPVCGTNNDCSNGGVCNGGCCDQGFLFFPDKCVTGKEDNACGAPGTVCQNCQQQGMTCVAGACQ